jgi:hypothetical protein
LCIHTYHVLLTSFYPRSVNDLVVYFSIERWGTS